MRDAHRLVYGEHRQLLVNQLRGLTHGVMPIAIKDKCRHDRHNVRAAFDVSGPPDVVMINLGTGIVKPLAETDRAVWDKTIALNPTAAFETLQEAAARMKPKGGAIVLTASTNSYDGEENLIAYNATKSGVLGLLHTAANELGPHGIRVNAVTPGLIRTRLTKGSFDNP